MNDTDQLVERIMQVGKNPQRIPLCGTYIPHCPDYELALDHMLNREVNKPRPSEYDQIMQWLEKVYQPKS